MIITVISLFTGCNNDNFDVNKIYETEAESIDISKNLSDNKKIIKAYTSIPSEKAQNIAKNLMKKDNTKIAKITVNKTKSKFHIDLEMKSDRGFIIVINNKGDLIQINETKERGKFLPLYVRGGYDHIGLDTQTPRCHLISYCVLIGRRHKKKHHSFKQGGKHYRPHLVR